MKKVKTVTFHLANNYGALLQAFALQQILQKKYDAEILNYDNTFISDNYRVFKPINKNPIKTIYHLFKDIINYNQEKKRVLAFDNFRKKLYLSDYFSDKDEKKLPEADAYIVGSDQVWNPFLTNGVDSIYTLKDVKKSKKISYAASSGNLKYIEQYKTEFLKNIQQFDAISVREKNLKEYLSKNLKGKTVETVLDPTLLLSKNEWINLCKDKKIENKLEEWLVFLSQDDPDMIIKLLNQNADFQEIYEEVYTICLNMERMMEMFSKELAILDRNTVKLMIDEMEEEVVEAKRKADEAVRKADEAESRAKQAEHREKQAREEVDNLKKELEKMKNI